MTEKEFDDMVKKNGNDPYKALKQIEILYKSGKKGIADWECWLAKYIFKD